VTRCLLSCHRNSVERQGRVARPVWRLSKFCPMREVVTRAFRKSGSSTRAGGRPFLIIASLQNSTNSAWVGVLISTVCPLPRHGRFPSALPAASTCTGVSAQPPTEIRLRFADAFASASKVFCRAMRGCLPALPENGSYQDHATLVVTQYGPSRVWEKCCRARGGVSSCLSAVAAVKVCLL
jgi:hypothetical protein